MKFRAEWQSWDQACESQEILEIYDEEPLKIEANSFEEALEKVKLETTSLLQKRRGEIIEKYGTFIPENQIPVQLPHIICLTNEFGEYRQYESKKKIYGNTIADIDY